MTPLARHDLIAQLNDRPIVIWGARMTGMGFLRFLRSNDLNAVSFVDSDPAFKEKNINAIPVYHPDHLPQLKEDHPRLVVVVAVSIKEKEILEQLNALDFDKNDIILYSDYCNAFYTIDVVGTCNLRCPSCAHGVVGPKPNRGIMDFDLFTKVIDKILKENELVTHVSLYSWGEPFLHPKLPEIIRHLHERGIAAAVSSNLSIKSTDYIQRIIQAGPEYLKVSLSGYYPDTYNETHTGGDINLVKSNLYRIRHFMDKFDVNTTVDVNYHLYTNNNGRNLEKMQELCTELGFFLSATYSLVMPLERCLDHCEGIIDLDTAKLQDILLVSIDEGLEVTKDFRSQSCPFKDNQTNINWDLSVPVCCTVYDRPGITVSNNFLESDPKTIQNNKDKAEICKKCIEYGLPAYNMGFNQQGWKQVAQTKTSNDT